VLLSGPRDRARTAHDEAAEATRLFEGTGDVLAAATGSAVAALAAVRAGEVGQALDDAVHALVAFGSLSDGERDPDGEAHLAELLGRLCAQFFDHERAVQFYELAARTVRGLPAGAGRDAWSARLQVRIADLLLQRSADDDGPQGAAREALLERAAGIGRSLLAGDRHDEGVRLLAAVDHAYGRAAEGLERLEGLPGDEARLRLARARCRAAGPGPAGALPDLDAAVAASEADGDLALHIEALLLRSEVREATGDLAGALADARQLAGLVWQRHRRQVGGFMDQVWSRAGVEGQRRDLEARARVLLRFAEQDSLTSLANRRAIEQFCSSMRPTEHVCLVLVDVDHFKGVNDRHGHLVGDVVLREVAAVLSGSVRSVDRVARWGGEEFLIALPGGTAVLGAEAADRLRRRIEEHAWSSHAPGLRLTVSAGVSAGPAGEFPAVLARADAAVYAAKRAGRNRVVSS
jgi:diguanylate cyclase (GGDEF)-like protein